MHLTNLKKKAAHQDRPRSR